MLKLNLEIFKSVKLPPNTLTRKLAQLLLHDPGLTVSPFQSALPLQSSVPGSAGAGLLWPLVMAVSVLELLFEILSSLSLQSVLLWLQPPLCRAETWAVAQEEESKSWVLPLLSLHYFHTSPTPQGQPRAWRRIKVNLNALFFLQVSTLRDFMNSFF